MRQRQSLTGGSCFATLKSGPNIPSLAQTPGSIHSEFGASGEVQPAYQDGFSWSWHFNYSQHNISVCFDRNAAQDACVTWPMRRSSYAGVIALVATVGLMGPPMAGTPSENFKFKYDSAYGHDGLSQPYVGPTTTGQSYGAGVAINPSDPSQKVYTLVEANPDIGVGGLRGAFPASSRTIPPSSSSASYLGPYYIVRRTNGGAIDTTFGANGYMSAFTTSTDANYKFTSLCLDPGNSNIVIVGQEMTSSGSVGIVERLTPPTKGSGAATLDTSFNRSGTTPGIVTIATPNGYNSPALYGCSVVDEGAGHSGAILVGGVDDSVSSSLVLVGKISSSGSFDTLFGTNGIVEYPVDSVDGSGTSAEITNVSLSGAHSDFPDVILSGFSFTKGTKDVRRRSRPR
jgi:hypothetical protein